ncbi:MAG TPA: type II toxin-antitoxin system VapC family toxin [Terracidiphilus sp.]|jgi:hypothetical protein|nr:type II toxin-antitoxin system VapC family toxin [Terracidiphilus sp.]
MSVLLDSDIVIEVLRARDEALLAQWAALGESQSSILITPVTIAEVETGAFAAEMEAVSRFFAPVVCVVIDSRIGRLAGEQLRRYGKSHGLKMADALIAASAIGCEAALWTRNRKHYPMPELSFYV